MKSTYPNPFRYRIAVEFAVVNLQKVQPFFSDLQGRKVATLVEQVLPAGYIRWYGRMMELHLISVRRYIS